MAADTRKSRTRIKKRPVTGSITEFLVDMVSLLRYRTLKRTVYQIYRDDILGVAAQLAFYLTLGLFPFLLVIFSLMGTFSSDQFAEDLLAYFVQVLPVQVYNLIDAYVADVLRGPQSGRRPALVQYHRYGVGDLHRLLGDCLRAQ